MSTRTENLLPLALLHLKLLFSGIYSYSLDIISLNGKKKFVVAKYERMDCVVDMI